MTPKLLRGGILKGLFLVMGCVFVIISKMLSIMFNYFILSFATQDVIETNAKQAWRDAYKTFLD